MENELCGLFFGESYIISLWSNIVYMRMLVNKGVDSYAEQTYIH